MITGQKDLDAISSKEEGNNSISEKNESEEETDDIQQQHMNSHKSPNIPNIKMKSEMQFSNQSNKYLYKLLTRAVKP